MAEKIDPMTTEGRAALRALAAQATPGPWDIEGPGPVGLLITAAHGTLVCKPYADNAAYLGSLGPDVVVAMIDHIDALEGASACIGGSLCKGGDEGSCPAQDGLMCTRRDGHPGDHVACGDTECNLHRWVR